jgi:hypothetical protein
MHSAQHHGHPVNNKLGAGCSLQWWRCYPSWFQKCSLFIFQEILASNWFALTADVSLASSSAAFFNLFHLCSSWTSASACICRNRASLSSSDTWWTPPPLRWLNEGPWFRTCWLSSLCLSSEPCSAPERQLEIWNFHCCAHQRLF